MSQPHEHLDGAPGPVPEELRSAGPWRNVPKPSIEELITPSVPGTTDAPRMPVAVKVGGLVLVALLLLLAAWLGLTLGGSAQPAPSPTPTIEVKPWELDPPVTMGKLVQGGRTDTPAGTNGDRDIVRTDYSDGTDKVVLLLSRPETDLARYLGDAGVEKSKPVEGASCGVSVDNNVPVCARVVDDTAITVAGLTDQNFTELASLVDSFYAAMK